MWTRNLPIPKNYMFRMVHCATANSDSSGKGGARGRKRNTSTVGDEKRFRAQRG
jgi:hypothetical protein